MFLKVTVPTIDVDLAPIVYIILFINLNVINHKQNLN